MTEEKGTPEEPTLIIEDLTPEADTEQDDVNEILEALEADEDFDDDNYITLVADGEEIEFEYLASVVYEGEEYVVLLPAGDDEESEVVILQVRTLDNPDNPDEPEEEYVSIETEEVLNAVFEIFKEEFAEVYEFVD